jgi:ferric iron reductase protein FhuF
MIVSQMLIVSVSIDVLWRVKALRGKDFFEKGTAIESPNVPVIAGPAPSMDSPAAGEMLLGLHSLFSEDLARYRNVFVHADDPREAISGPEFLQPGTLSTLMARFRPQFAAADQRGLASIWINQYFNRLFPPVISAALLLNQRMPLRLEQLAVVVDDQGLPLAFKLPGGCEPLASPETPFERFAHLLDDNLQPLIQALCAHTGVSAKVLWSNAGNYFEAWLGQLKSRTQQPQLLVDGERLLASPRRPDGSRNPLYAPIRYVEIEHADGQVRPWRQRRLCCIRDLLPEVKLCPNCPRLKQPYAASDSQ